MNVLLLLACTGEEPPKNQAPIITSVTLSPAQVYEGDTISSQVTWDDPEGEPVHLTYAWMVNGGLAQEGTGTVLTSDYFGAGDEVVLEVSGNDGNSDGDPTASDALVILNTAPTLSGATISPTEPTVDDTLTVTLEGGDDVDGDELTYTTTWYVRNAAVATGDELTSDQFKRADDIFVEVVPNDGTEDGDEVRSDKVTVQNSPPVITEVWIEPETVGTEDTITASASGVDSDGDSVIIRYDWYVDGEKVNGVTSTELEGVHFVRDQVVYVIASGNDGINQGEGLQSDDVQVVNAQPSAPIVEISPQNVGPDNDLSCAVVEDGESVDPDPEDEVTYTFEWTVNGTSYPDATETDWPGDTVTSDDTSIDDVWVCYGYGTDGSLVSEAGTDEITVESIYSIGIADLVNMGSTCSTTYQETMYNGCDGSDVGFTWTDSESAAPTSVTIEVNHGISCSYMDYTLSLNGNELTDTWALNYSCSCTPTEQEWSTTLTSTEIADYYLPGAENEFTIEGDNCEGITQNDTWDDAYARVLVAY